MKAAILSSFLIRSGVHSNEKFSDRKFLNEAAGENIGPGARLILASRARREAAFAAIVAVTLRATSLRTALAR